MEYDPTRMCELIVGLGDVEVLGVGDEEGEPLRIHVRCRAVGVENCVVAGQAAFRYSLMSPPQRAVFTTWR